MFEYGKDSGLVLMFEVHQGFVTRRYDSSVVFNKGNVEEFNNAIAKSAIAIIERNKDVIQDNPYDDTDTEFELKVEYESEEQYVSLGIKLSMDMLNNDTHKQYISLAGRLIKAIK